jgi:hypothetical protein
MGSNPLADPPVIEPDPGLPPATADMDDEDADWVIALDSMAEPDSSPFFEEQPPARRTLLGRRRQS